MPLYFDLSNKYLPYSVKLTIVLHPVFFSNTTKYNLRDSTRNGYLYTYNKFVRPTFGKRKLVDVKFSDVMHFYLHLINVDGLALGTLDSRERLLALSKKSYCISSDRKIIINVKETKDKLWSYRL